MQSGNSAALHSAVSIRLDSAIRVREDMKKGINQNMAQKGKTVLNRSEHCVSRQDIDADALKVLYRLSNHGFDAYLVGGGVRDLLLGRHPKDFDIGTNAHPGEIKKLFRNCLLIGRRFRLAHIRFGRKVIETSTFRCDPTKDDGADGEDLYQHRDNTFGTAEEDARRRDFTINGLFYDIRDFRVIDHVQGLVDLKKKLIRCIGDPDIRFREDPVRMIRAIRFAARLGFRIEKGTYRAILKHRGEIANASPARLFDEMHKLFAFGAGCQSFKLLHKTRLMEELFPEISEYLRRTSRRDNLLWRHLDALDAGVVSIDEPTNALRLGTLFYSVFLDRLAVESAGAEPVRHEDIASQLIQPAARRFGMPKLVYYRLVHMFADQRRFMPTQGRRFSRDSFVTRESFPETLALYELDLVARGEDMSALEPWKELYRRYLLSSEKSGSPAERKSGQRRRRRPRRPRRPRRES